MTSISRPVLELSLPSPRVNRTRWGLRHKLIAALVTAGAVLLAVAVLASPAASIDSAISALGIGDRGAPAVRIDLDQVHALAEMTVDDRTQIVAEGTTAQERNASIPLSSAPVEPAKGFELANFAKAEIPTALKCLTQAVYYEAAFEPLTGRRAVAQVVLNRMRHPAYPKSVCGVVYQGSHRRTGCQFSFTCDGALLRTPAAGAWREAEAVARAALAGHVEASVGTATHYHADYVLPKWAFNLGKIDQIGRHIFYRFNGSWGRAAAFRERYAGSEQIPHLNLVVLRQRMAEGDLSQLPGDTVPGLTVARHVTDRHAINDVGGRIDVTKAWRLEIPDPVAASSRYRSVAGEVSSPPIQGHASGATDVDNTALSQIASQP